MLITCRLWIVLGDLRLHVINTKGNFLLLSVYMQMFIVLPYNIISIFSLTESVSVWQWIYCECFQLNWVSRFCLCQVRLSTNLP